MTVIAEGADIQKEFLADQYGVISSHCHRCFSFQFFDICVKLGCSVYRKRWKERRGVKRRRNDSDVQRKRERGKKKKKENRKKRKKNDC